MSKTRLKVEFTGASGALLTARLDAPAAPPLAYALFAHCFTCSKDTRASVYIAGALAEQGIATLRFDFTGLGDSGGDFAATGFASNIDDLLAAAAYLRRAHRAPALLVGHSLGGTASLVAASRIPECAAVATLGSPFDPAHVLDKIPPRQQRQIEHAGEAVVAIAGRRIRLGKPFLEQATGQSMDARIGRLGKALLVMHSPGDDVVDIEHATRIFTAAAHPKSFISLDTADHLLSRQADARYAGRVLAAWAARYIGASAL